MALKKMNETNINTAPAFEEVAENQAAQVVEQAAAPVDSATTQAAPADPAQAAAQATTAIATVQASSAVSVASREASARFKAELDEMRDALSFDYGTLRIFKASNGAISEPGNGKASFGRWVLGRMMAYGSFWQVTPGGEGTKLKGFVAFSKDGKTIDSVIGDGAEAGFVGKPVTKYLDYLRNTEGLAGAEVKPYMNVAFLVLDSERPAVEQGETVNIVLSQTSMRAFTAYEEQLKIAARAAAMGLPTKGLPEDPFRFKFVAEEASNQKSQRWTRIAIESAS